MSLQQFLTALPERTFTDASAFERAATRGFVTSLGYDEEALHRRVALDPGYDRIPDAMVARDRSSRPHLLVETVFEHDGVPEDVRTTLDEYAEHVGADYAVTLAPGELAVGPEDPVSVDLTGLCSADVDSVRTRLSPPDSLPRESLAGDGEPDERVVDTGRFTLDLDEYESTLETVRNPPSPVEKGEALEDVAELLFDGIDVTTVTEQNLYTDTAEIDVAVRHDGAGAGIGTLFDAHSRYVLVECKNWSEPVGAKQVRDFKGKLQAANVDLGVFFAQNGVSGGSRGEFALGEVDMAFRNEDIAVVVVDDTDLEWVRQGNDFYDLLERKLYALRFRRQSPFGGPRNDH